MATKKKPTQLDRIEAKIDELIDRSKTTHSLQTSDHDHIVQRIIPKIELILSGATFMQELDKATPQPEGLQPGDYTDASKATADALTAMGWGWVDDDRTKHKNIRRNMFPLGGSGPYMCNIGKSAHCTNKLDPATFLSRAAVTAKEIGLVPEVEETWPQGTLFVHDNCKDVDRVRYDKDGFVHSCDGFRSFHKSRCRKISDAEIAAHLAEQEAKANAEKVAKLKWGVRVKTQKGREYRIACDKPNEEGLYRVAPDVAYTYDAPMLSVDEFTVIDTQP